MGQSRIGCVAVFLWPVILCAQAGPDEVRVSSRPYVPTPYIRVESKLVELTVSVRDAKGRAIRGLKRENFQITDEGKQREIAAFSEEETASAPVSAASATAPTAKEAAPGPAPSRFVALLFDDVNSQDSFDANDLARSQAAARRLVKDAIQPGTRLAVFTVSGTVSQDFTNDPAKLTAAIASLKPHPMVSEKGSERCPKITPYRAYKIAHDQDRETLNVTMMTAGCAASRDYVMLEAEQLWNKVKEASTRTLAAMDRVVDHLGAMPGARVMVMSSSGFFGQSLELQQHAVIDHAIRSRVVINALEAKGLYDEPPPIARPDDPSFLNGRVRAATVYLSSETKALPDRLAMADSAMADIAQGTGGEFFHNNNDFYLGFRELSVPPEVTYRISFRPEGVAADGGYHKLKVTLAHEGSYKVETRPGYFAPLDKPADDPRQKLDRAVASSDTMADVPAGLAVQMGKSAGDQRILRVVVRIDLSKLSCGAQDGRKMQRITFVTALLDAQGKAVAAKEGSMDLALKPETYDRLAKSGLNAELSFQVAPGLYSLREVVQESVNGALSSSTNPIDVK